MAFIEKLYNAFKPGILRGTKLLNPSETGRIDSSLIVIRQEDVNFYIYFKNDTHIAFDSGIGLKTDVYKEFEKVNFDSEKVSVVFFTHADIDHAGGMNVKGAPIFKNAHIYAHKNEEGMLRGTARRTKVGPIAFKNPVNILENYSLLNDGQIVKVGDIKIEVIYTPGHTKGHTSYIVDDEILVLGDAMLIKDDGGYTFPKMFNVNSKEAMESAFKLKEACKDRNLKIILSGHSGFRTNISNLFENINTFAKGTKKEPFDESAPYDLFK